MGRYFRLDTRAFEKALKTAVDLGGKRDVEGLLLTQARGFVRQVVAITPPSHDGVQGLQARRAGEATIASDVKRVVAPARVLKTTGKLQKHEKGLNIRVLVDVKRNPRSGRVSTGQRRPLHVGVPAEVNAEIKRRQKGVGWLAAGWKAAADKVGVKLPAWITRHDAPSLAMLSVDRRRMRLKMTNAVSFASDVKGLERRVQWALSSQTRALNRGTDGYLRRKMQRAGFRVR